MLDNERNAIEVNNANCYLLSNITDFYMILECECCSTLCSVKTDHNSFVVPERVSEFDEHFFWPTNWTHNSTILNHPHLGTLLILIFAFFSISLLSTLVFISLQIHFIITMLTIIIIISVIINVIIIYELWPAYRCLISCPAWWCYKPTTWCPIAMHTKLTTNFQSFYSLL